MQPNVLIGPDSTVSIWNFGFRRTYFHELTGIYKVGYKPPPGVGLTKAGDVYSCAMIFLALAIAATEFPSPSGEDSDDDFDVEPDEKALEKFAAGAAAYYRFAKLSNDFLRSAISPEGRSFPEMPDSIGVARNLTKNQWGLLWQLIVDMAKSGRPQAASSISMQDVLNRLRQTFALPVD